MQNLFNSLSRPIFGDRSCPHCKEHINNDSTFLNHLFSTHLAAFDLNSVTHWLEENNFPELLKFADDISSLTLN